MWSGPKSWWKALYSNVSSTVKYKTFFGEILILGFLFLFEGDLPKRLGFAWEVVLYGSGIGVGGKGVPLVGGEVYDARYKRSGTS